MRQQYIIQGEKKRRKFVYHLQTIIVHIDLSYIIISLQTAWLPVKYSRISIFNAMRNCAAMLLLVMLYPHVKKLIPTIT